MKRSIYRRNLTALRKVNNGLADWIENAKQPDWARPFKSNDGKANVLLKAGIHEFPIYPVDDTLKEITPAASNLPREAHLVAFIMGMGVGHLAIATLRRMKKGSRLVVVEPEAWFIQQAFRIYDFSSRLEKMELCIATSNEEIAALVGLFDGGMVVEYWFMLSETYTQRRTQTYGKISAYATDVINQAQCNTGTVIGAALRIAQNDISSLPWCVNRRGVVELRNLFVDKPAVVVATGPSLELNVRWLREYRDKVVIIAVAQALRPLLGYGITPDLICTVDYGETNISHFRGLMSSGVPLVAINRAYAPILQQWAGPVFLSANPAEPGTEGTVTSLLADKGFVEQGGSVSHMAFGVAWALGCSPIMLAGLDLALGERSHISTVDSGGKVIVRDGEIEWEVTDPASNLAGGKYSMGPETYVRGYFDRLVLTNGGLRAFITAFESIISRCPAQVIDCTEGGARKEGTTLMGLRDALQQYTDGALDKTPLLNLCSPFPDPPISRALELVEKELATCQEIKMLCDGALADREEMDAAFEKWTKKKCGKSPAFEALGGKELYVRQLQATKDAHDKAMMLPLVRLSIFGALRQIRGSRLKMTRSIAAVKTRRDIDDVRIGLERNKLILEAAQKACVDLIPCYEQARDGLRRLQRGENITVPENYVPDLAKARELMASGGYARVITDAACFTGAGREYGGEAVEWHDLVVSATALIEDQLEKTERENPTELREKLIRYHEWIRLSKKPGMEKDFEEALRFQKLAHETLPDRPEAMWGMATVLHLLNRPDEAEQAYRELVAALEKQTPEEAEQNAFWLCSLPRARKEFGMVLLGREKWNEAIVQMRAALPDAPEIGLMLAKVEQKHGDIACAHAVIQGYCAAFSGTREGWLTYAEICGQTGQKEEQENALREAGRLA